MSLYKKRILKSEEVRIVSGIGIRMERDEEDVPRVAPAENTRAPLEEAYARGLAEGRALGKKEAEKELNRLLNMLRKAIDEVVRLRGEIIAHAEKEVVALATAIAEKVIHQELSNNREAVRAVFKRAMEAIGEKEKLVVRCNPADLQVLEGYLRDLQASQGGIGEVEFVTDTHLEPGGVKIEATYCEVDASLESQFAMIRKMLFS